VRQPVLLSLGKNSSADGVGDAKTSYLTDFPFPSGPTYFETVNPLIPDDDARIVKIESDRNVEMPVVDLDNDGKPELVILKNNRADPSKISADAQMKAGVWAHQQPEANPRGPVAIREQDAVSAHSLTDILALDRRPQQAGFTPSCTSTTRAGRRHRCRFRGRASSGPCCRHSGCCPAAPTG
jgi:hypothetical protein